MIKIRVYIQVAVDDEIDVDAEIDDISQAEEKANEIAEQYYGSKCEWEVIDNDQCKQG
jgi:hypothetical protein